MTIPTTNLNANILAAAAMDAMPTLEQEVLFEVDCAIAETDVQKAWDPTLLEKYAMLELGAWGRARSKLLAKFGGGLSVRILDAKVAEVRKRLKRPVSLRAEGELAVVQVNGRPLRDISEESMRALRHANDPPRLFIRSGEMVFIEVDERQRPKISPVSVDHLRGRLDRCANFMRRSESGDVSVAPPVDVVRDIMSLPSSTWELPPLDVLVEVPTLRPDGTVVVKNGYDAPSKMYYEPDGNLRMDPIPPDPCTDEVYAARDLVLEVIEDFPFCDDDVEVMGQPRQSASRANFLGLLLTPIIRPAITGSTPLALIDAPQAGTGKSLLADVFSIITTGRPCSMMPFPREDTEMQKLIGATLLQGRSLVCFDNLEGVLASPTLALVLTAKEYETRILGLSQNMTAPNRATWLATGNNLRPSGDMPRRCYHIRIDAESSQPYRGRSFKHDPLLDYVIEHRAELLRALLIIARAWYAHGSRRVVEQPLGSFEQWHRAVAGMLHGAGVKGFLGNLDPFLSEADDTQVQWERFLTELDDHYDGLSFTAGRIAEQIRNATREYPSPFSLPDTLGDVDRKKEGGLERALGRSFTKRAGTRFGPRQLHLDRRYDGHDKMFKWTVKGK